jgi:hypothetical protein
VQKQIDIIVQKHGVGSLCVNVERLLRQGTLEVLISLLVLAPNLGHQTQT